MSLPSLILSIKPGTAILQPGKETMLEIRAEKSPSIQDDVKSMKIIFKTDMFGIQNNISLSQKTIDFEKKVVDSFNTK